jgi:hypothetical protein
MVSRDRKDSDDLVQLITTTASSSEFKAAASGALGLALAAPPVAAVVAAIEGAFTQEHFSFWYTVERVVEG